MNLAEMGRQNLIIKTGLMTDLPKTWQQPNLSNHYIVYGPYLASGDT